MLQTADDCNTASHNRGAGKFMRIAFQCFEAQRVNSEQTERYRQHHCCNGGQRENHRAGDDRRGSQNAGSRQNRQQCFAGAKDKNDEKHPDGNVLSSGCFRHQVVRVPVFVSQPPAQSPKQICGAEPYQGISGNVSSVILNPGKVFFAQPMRKIDECQGNQQSAADMSDAADKRPEQSFFQAIAAAFGDGDERQVVIRAGNRVDNSR